MAKSDPQRFEKKSIRLFKGDAEALNRFYPQAGYNRAIRTLVHQHIKALEEKLSRRISDSALEDAKEEDEI